MNPKVDEFLRKAQKWPDELARLRTIVLDCGLVEDFKWYQPCYTFQNSNVAIISEFKDYCSLAFFKGALLSDPSALLIRPGENTQSGRQMRFTNVAQINEMEAVIKAYLYEAIQVEKAGLTIHYKTTDEYSIPLELQAKLNSFPALKTAFEALTPGRQRAYILHFSTPKQSQTRQARVEKYIQHILNGKGLND